MNEKEILTLARAKIAQGWTRGYYAADKDGDYVEPKDPSAVCWCTIGAIQAVAEDHWEGYQAELPLRDTLFNLFLNRSITDFNDAKDRTQAEVLNLFDKAISACSGEAQVGS